MTRLFGNSLSLSLHDPLRFYANFPEVIALRAPADLVVLTDDGETHMMCGVTHEVCPSVRMRVAIRFVQDGPTGGYWKIVRTLDPAEAKP